MAKFDFKMVLEYPKLFEYNADMGNADAKPRTMQRELFDKGGQTIVNAYFTSDADIQKLLDAGMDPAPLGHARVADGNAEFGIGKYIKLKRGLADNIRTFEQKNGSEVEVNYGGLPKVIDLRDPENKKLWDPDEDGSIGNGSEAIVRFDLYSRGAGVRLEAVAVTTLVAYESQEQSEYADVWDT